MSFDELSSHQIHQIELAADSLGKEEKVTVPNGFMSAIPHDELVKQVLGLRRALAKEIAKDPARVAEIERNPRFMIADVTPMHATRLTR